MASPRSRRPAKGDGSRSLDELGERRDRGEDLAADLLALDLDAELLLERHHQLERVHRIEPQPLPEQGGLVLDHLRPHPFQVEALDDQTLDPIRGGDDCFRHKAKTSEVRRPLSSTVRRRPQVVLTPKGQC
jgi:hypothetical protein